jgi:hypothetical protein
MKKIVLSLLLVSNLTACAGALSWVGDYANAQDPCQYKGKKEGYQLPYFCGAATGHTVQVSRGAYNGTYLVNVK